MFSFTTHAILSGFQLNIIIYSKTYVIIIYKCICNIPLYIALLEVGYTFPLTRPGHQYEGRDPGIILYTNCKLRNKYFIYFHSPVPLNFRQLFSFHTQGFVFRFVIPFWYSVSLKISLWFSLVIIFSELYLSLLIKYDLYY